MRMGDIRQCKLAGRRQATAKRFWEQIFLAKVTPFSVLGGVASNVAGVSWGLWMLFLQEV